MGVCTVYGGILKCVRLSVIVTRGDVFDGDGRGVGNRPMVIAGTPAEVISVRVPAVGG